MKPLIALSLILLFTNHLNGQGMLNAAKQFLNTLDAAQKSKAQYPFDTEERFNFHFFPKNDRKGISLNEMNEAQKKAAFNLVKTCLSEQAFRKTREIIALETVLKAVENRKPEDNFRDPGKYYFTIFGLPGQKTIWGWRLEGHHVSFNFSAHDNKLISGTPGFLGTNPAIVMQGPQKGKQVLKEEADLGFQLLHMLSADGLKKAIIDTLAPNEIITFVSRKAMLQKNAGIAFTDLAPPQQQLLLKLVKLYVDRYTRLFSEEMLKDIQNAGFENLWFAWAGHTTPEVGKAHYYRIQGPTFIIEYDNSQSNANHVHSVFRDLKNDFGEDYLQEHYNTAHQQ
ncbi:MAG TPA: DUF3500 domain-containing protein [Chitinophagaceae bacterium]|nr:DUF3500 domain-containing protein [Chitinophagaceae bacterium]